MLRLARHHAYIYIRHAKEGVYFGSRTVYPGVECQQLEDLDYYKRDI